MSRVWPLAARCSIRGVLVATAVSVVTVTAGVMAGVTTSIGLGVLIGATFFLFAGHGAWRTAEAVVEFADTVPKEPVVETEAGRVARLTWPALNLTLTGEAAVLKEPELEAEAAGRTLEASVEESRELAQEALEELGIDPEP